MNKWKRLEEAIKYQINIWNEQESLLKVGKTKEAKKLEVKRIKHLNSEHKEALEACGKGKVVEVEKEVELNPKCSFDEVGIHLWDYHKPNIYWENCFKSYVESGMVPYKIVLDRPDTKPGVVLYFRKKTWWEKLIEGLFSNDRKSN